MSALPDDSHPYQAPSRAVARRQMLLVAVLVPLFVAAFQRAVTSLYALNFSTAGPNETALLVVLLATGWVVPLAAAVRTHRPLSLALALAPAALWFALAADPLRAALGAVALATLATPLLVALLQSLREWFAVAAGVGVALHAAIRGWLGTAPPYATDLGIAVLAMLLAVSLWLWVALWRREALPTLGRVGVSAAPLGVFLIAQATFLGSPQVVARWALRPYVPMGVLTIAGSLAGAWWVHRPHELDRQASMLWGGALVVSLAALLWLNAGGIPFLFAGQAAAVVVLATGCRPGDRRPAWRAGASMAIAQLVAVVLVFAHVAAVNWAYMPAPVDTVARSRGPVALFALGVLLPAAVVVTRPEPIQLQPRYERSRRETMALVGGALLGSLGFGTGSRLAVGRSNYGTPTDPGSLRVLSYNVHQWLSGGDEATVTLQPLLTALRESGAHVVALQESEGARITAGNVDGVRWLADRLGYHAAYGAATERGGYGVALLSAWSIESSRIVSLPVNDSPPRWAQVATVRTPDGPLTVVNTHFQTDTGSDRQLEEAGAVLDELDGVDRAVVLGDFNVTPDTETYERLTASLTDAWLAGGGDPDGGATYSASDPNDRIDYVFLRGTWDVESVERVGDPSVSDHLGVLADLER